MSGFPEELVSVVSDIAARDRMLVQEYPERWDYIDLSLQWLEEDVLYHLDFILLPYTEDLRIFLFAYRIEEDPASHPDLHAFLKHLRSRVGSKEKIEAMAFVEEYKATIDPGQFRDKVEAYIQAARMCADHPAPYYRLNGYLQTVPVMVRTQQVYPWPHNPDAVPLPEGPLEFPLEPAAVIRDVAAARGLKWTGYPSRWGVCEIELMGETNHVTWDIAFTYSPLLREIGVSYFLYGWKPEERPKRSFVCRAIRRALRIPEKSKSHYASLDHIDRDALPQDISQEAFRDEVLIHVGRVEGLSRTFTTAPPPLFRIVNAQ